MTHSSTVRPLEPSKTAWIAVLFPTPGSTPSISGLRARSGCPHEERVHLDQHARPRSPRRPWGCWPPALLGCCDRDPHARTWTCMVIPLWPHRASFKTYEPVECQTCDLDCHFFCRGTTKRTHKTESRTALENWPTCQTCGRTHRKSSATSNRLQESSSQLHAYSCRCHSCVGTRSRTKRAGSGSDGTGTLSWTLQSGSPPPSEPSRGGKIVRVIIPSSCGGRERPRHSST